MKTSETKTLSHKIIPFLLLWVLIIIFKNRKNLWFGDSRFPGILISYSQVPSINIYTEFENTLLAVFFIPFINSPWSTDLFKITFTSNFRSLGKGIKPRFMLDLSIMLSKDFVKPCPKLPLPMTSLWGWDVVILSVPLCVHIQKWKINLLKHNLQ